MNQIEEDEQIDEHTDDERQWLLYTEYMSLEYELNKAVDSINNDNCHIFADLLVKRKPIVAEALKEEIKWQIKSQKN